MARPRQGVVRLGVLLATVVAGLTLGACGGSADSPGGPPAAGPAAPADAVAKIKAQFAKQSTYAFETLIVAKDPSGKPFFGEIHEAGVVQLSPLASKVDFTVSTGTETLGQTSQNIFVNNKSYTKGEGEWAEDTELEAVTQRDPKAALVMLDATKDLHQIGTDSINGTTTTGYGGSFTGDQFNQLPSNDPAVAALKDAFITGEKTVVYTVEVWVDSSFLVHRLTLTWKSPAAGVAPELNNTNSITFSKFNDPVDIKAPI